MKKNLLFFVLALPLLLNAQLTSEDFESYTEGAFDAQWDASEWVGWFGGTSNADISTAQASSGLNSIFIQDDNGTATDIMALFGELNSGIFEITFKQYIPAGNGAYYNMQHNYTNTAGDWAAEIYFGDATLALGQITTNNIPVQFEIAHDQWIENKYVFNFAIDEAEFYYNENLIHTWQISTNAAGGPGLNQINGLNLFAACLGAGCVSQAYYDDITVEEIPLPNIDAAVTVAGRASQYTMVPDGQVQPFELSATVGNQGLSIVTNVEVTANIYDGSNTLVHTESLGSVADIAPSGTSDFAAASTFTPSGSDSYTIEYSVTMDETDENMGNNTLSSTADFAITTDTYARDNGEYPDGLGFNGQTGIMGQNFEFINGAVVKSITMSYAGGGVGESISGHIYSMEAGMPADLIASTDAYLIEMAGAVGSEVAVELLFPNSVFLGPGTYAFMVEQAGTINLFLSISTDIFTPEATWATLDNGLTWVTLESLGFAIAFNIRPILDLTNNVEEPIAVENFDVSPNPSAGPVNVNLELKETSDLMLSVYNLQGQLVHSLVDYSVNGSTQYQLDLSDLSSGMYMLQLTIKDQVISRKLNLTK